MLLNNPENAPPVCYEYCASRKGDHEKKEITETYRVERRH